MNSVGKLLPQKAVADELGCCVRTIVRRAAADLAFPRPVRIGMRYYFSEEQVEAYKRKLIAPVAPSVAPDDNLEQFPS